MIKQMLIVLAWVFSIVMLHQFLNLSTTLSLFVLILGLVFWARFKGTYLINVAPFIVLIVMLGWLMSIQPRSDRNWWLETSILPSIEITNDQVRIDNFRNFHWQDRIKSDLNWENRSYNLSALENLDLIVEPFKNSEFMAHTMLVFGFKDQGHVVVSVEARKEQHEEYDLLAGTMRQFEIIYIFGDERDLLAQRAIHRNSELYLYPIKADKTFIINLFKDLAKSANSLHKQAKFYGTIRDNCTTTLVKHIDRHYDNKIGFRYEVLFPAQAGKLLYEFGQMDTTLPYEKVKSASKIDDLVRKYIDQPNFSTIIRAQSTDPYKTGESTTS
ncbi:MAG: DUF4105 domain-containing protein [Gammaproteobacteria bacterium]